MKRFLFVLLSVLSASTFAADTRQLVQMPEEARAELRAEMLDFQSALHQIIAALAAGKHVEAAETAEKMIGLSAQGRHRNAPVNARPGRYMPPDMHAIASNMHASASEFAKTASAGDTLKALGALQGLTGNCVGCHRAYRTQ